MIRLPFVVTFGLVLAHANAQQLVTQTDPSPAIAVNSSANKPVAGQFGWFRAQDVWSYGLYRTDGTVAGTERVLEGWLEPRHEFAGMALFSSSNNSLTGIGLFRTDGTVAGTVQLLPHINATTVLGSCNGRLIFTNANGFAHDIWSTDMTPAGTTLLGQVSDLRFGIEHNNEVLIFARVGNSLPGIHATDGTSFAPRHTFALADVVHPNASSAAVLGSKVFFLVQHSTGTGSVDELWQTDGTKTSSVTALGPSTGRQIARAGNVLVMTGDPGTTTIVASDGTAAGTAVMTTQTPAFTLRTAGNLAFFVGSDPAHGFELWRTDGTNAGTFLLFDATPGPGSSNLANLTGGTSKMFCFLGASQLLSSDGTTAGTGFMPAPALAIANSGGLAVLGDTALVTGPVGPGVEMLATDGTAAGTVQLTSNELRPGMGAPLAAAPLLNELCFVCDNNLHGRELWRTNGTAAGTALIEDIAPGPADAVGEVVTAAGDLWFNACRRRIRCWAMSCIAPTARPQEHR